MVGEYVLRTDGDVRRLIINYKGSPFGADVAQYAEAMKDVIDKLKIVDADEIVLSEYYERIYNAEQTTMLRELANLINRLETDSVWSPSHIGTTRDSKKLASRHDAVLSIVHNLYADPFKAYLSIIQESKTVKARVESYQGEDKADLAKYLETLEFIHAQMEKLSIVKKMKVYVSQLGEIPTDRGIYHSLFEVSIKPSFIGSRIFFSGIESLELVDQYEVLGSTVYIYKHPDSVEYRYYINPPEYTLPPDKYFLLEKTKEVVAGHRPGDVGFMDVGAARQYFHKVYVGTISDLAKQNNIDLSVEEKEDLATIVSRYTIGYGILELLLSDRQLTDVYLDSPLGTKPIYLVHSKYGQCQTNIIFSQEEALSIVSRFRAMSGRPFDEAHPILDFDLADLQTRIAVIGKPLAVDGTAFAFRLHKDTPWTLAQFLAGKMFNKTAAGLFSFFVDAQASMLIVGSRGAGKCLAGDSLVQLPDGRLERIQDLVEPRLAAAKTLTDVGDGVCADCSDLSVFTLAPDLKVRPTPVTKVWRRTAPAHLLRITLASGKQIDCTPEHPLFVVRQGLVLPIRADVLEVGEHVATPRSLAVMPSEAPRSAPVPVESCNQAYLGGMALVQQDLADISRREPLTVAAGKMGLGYKTLLNLKNGVRNGVSGQELAALSRHSGRPLEEYLSRATAVRDYHSRQHLPIGLEQKPLDEDFARFLGLLYGDGHIDATEITLTNVEASLRDNFADLAMKLFGAISYQRQPKNRSPMTQITSRALSRFISSRFSIHLGNKASVQQLPEELLKSDDRILAEFIRAYFDCDASVSSKTAEIEFATASRVMALQLQLALLRFGIVSFRKRKVVNGQEYWRLFIRGESAKNYFNRIGFGLARKQEKLVRAVTGQKFNTNVDVVPSSKFFLQYSKAHYGFGKVSLDQKELGRSKFQNLADAFVSKQPHDPVAVQMKRLGESDIFWDSITSIENVEPKAPFVYDLTVDLTHSFIANGIIAHNTSFLQAMMQEIPQNLRIIVQEDSVTGDSEIVVERNGVMQQTTVGELVDGELAASGIGFDEYSSVVPASLRVFSVSDGRVKLSSVSKLIRHRVTKPLYKLTTVSGKSVTVTGDHSLFSIVDDVLIPVKTALLQPGDRIAGANVGLASDGTLQQLLADYVEELVAFVEPAGTRESFVYDLSVPESENFVCNGIVAHNTQELPVPALKRFGFNIQRMKTRPPLGKQSDSEVSAEDALRTALRLGDSVLIVGEVRSGEARALYEAMRVGAVGNVVMGTIHGESAYSIWDRVVNDLGVPTTSFKATDFAIVAAPIRFKGSLKRNRRLIEVTEVLKHWNHDPGEEGGFLEWMRFDANKDEVDFFTDKLKDSEWVKRVGRTRGLSLDDIMNEANARGDSKQALVDLSREFNVPRLLEADYTVRAHNKYLLMEEKQRDEFGSVDHSKLLEDWNAWARDILAKEAVTEANATKVS
ncbi:hypothetical protein AUJ14_02795 [Candidatus Micrarchaeota archaeon CG1_02_55_22]|nr:MAG: hypothetical protein AUJ14_02795 [Candidatus Micrarchaeota archaeon CG1_02_55_22]